MGSTCTILFSPSSHSRGCTSLPRIAELVVISFLALGCDSGPAQDAQSANAVNAAGVGAAAPSGGLPGAAQSAAGAGATSANGAAAPSGGLAGTGVLFRAAQRLARALLLQAALSPALALLLRAGQQRALALLLRAALSPALVLPLRAALSLAPAFRWEERAFRSPAWARSLLRQRPSR